jgi:branched-chain amino acid aminotransferase
MQIGDKIWRDGQIENASDAKFSLLSHSLHYGSAIFEGMRFYSTPQGPAILKLREHTQRFFHSASAIQFTLSYTQDAFNAAIIEMVRQNGFQQGYIRLIGFFGEGDMELHPLHAKRHVAILIWPWEPRMGTDSIRVKISSFLRTPPRTTIITAKLSGHYANSILARQEARQEGYDEALLLDFNGHIAEGPGANFFAVMDDVLVTPPSHNLFAGITRECVLEMTQKLGIQCRVDNIHPSQLSSCDEAFFTGTAMEIISIQSIDSHLLKKRKGPTTMKLKSQFAQNIEGKDSHYHHWLSFIASQ